MNEKLLKYWQFFRRVSKRKEGQTLIEYGLILVLVTIVMFSILFAMSDSLRAIFGKVTQTLATASGS